MIMMKMATKKTKELWLRHTAPRKGGSLSDKTG
jgi:hypothetical protein